MGLVTARNWPAAIDHGRIMIKHHGSVSGLVTSWSSILACSASPQMHTSASRKLPVPALTFPAAYPEETSTGLRLGESSTQAGRDVTERVVAGMQGVLALAVTAGTRASQALEAWQGKRAARVNAGYLQYLTSLSDGRMLNDELRERFAVPVRLTCDNYQYQPWQMLLERLFPDTFGYEIRLEKVLEERVTFSDGAIVDLQDWFLVVRHGPRRHVRLLANGFDPTHPGNLERSFAMLMDTLEPMAEQLMHSQPAEETVSWLTFCGQDFCWGEISGGSSLRLGPVSRLQQGTGEESLFQLAQHIHSLLGRQTWFSSCSHL